MPIETGEALRPKDAGKDVVLTISVGNAKLGASNVRVGQPDNMQGAKIIEGEESDGKQTFHLGSGEEIAGCTVLCVTAITDVTGVGKKVTVTWSFENAESLWGGGDFVLEESAKMESNADDATAQFDFKAAKP